MDELLSLGDHGLMRVLAVGWRILRLSPTDWRDLWRAEWAIFMSQVRMWTTPVGRLVSAASQKPVMAVPAVAAMEPATSRALELSTAVRRAAKYGPVRAACLARSLALVRMLERERITGARLRVGVKRTGQRLEAHAWVELGGRVVNDTTEHALQYAPLADVREMLPGLQSTRV